MPLELNPFEYQKPDEHQIAQIEKVRAKCSELYELLSNINDTEPFKTVQALNYMQEAKIKVNEASMWANKAITFNK